MPSYLVHNIVEGVWAIDGKTDEKKVGLWVAQRTETVVLLLTSGIPECQLNLLSSALVDWVCNVVLEDGWNVFLTEVSTRFTSKLESLLSHFWKNPLTVADQ